MLRSQNLDRILPFLAAGTFASLFLKENFNSILLIVFSCAIVFKVLHKKEFSGIKNDLALYFPMLLYLFLAIIGSFMDNGSNVDYVIRLIPFTLTPLFLYYFRSISSRNKTKLALVFIMANILFLLFLDVFAIYDMAKNSSFYIEQGGRNYYRFLYSRYTMGFFNHIYLGIYSLLSMVLIHQYKILSKFGRLFFSLYLVSHIALLGSRAVIIAALIAGMIFLIYASFKNKKFLKYLAGFIGVIIISTSVVYIFKDTLLFNRYSQAFEWYHHKDLLLKRNYSINNRAKIYIVGFSMFKDYHRYGINSTGMASNEIKEKYESKFKDQFQLKTNTYNPHNQYVNNFIDWGVLGLILLLILLYLPLKDAANQKSNWITYFWLFFAIILMMESVLIRHRGIMLFVIFYSFFLTKNKPKIDEIE